MACPPLATYLNQLEEDSYAIAWAVSPAESVVCKLLAMVIAFGHVP